MKTAGKRTWIACLLAATMLTEAAPIAVLADAITVEDTVIEDSSTAEYDVLDVSWRVDFGTLTIDWYYFLYDNDYDGRVATAIIEMQNADGTWTTLASDEYSQGRCYVRLSDPYTDLTIRVKIEDTDETVLAMSESISAIKDGFSYVIIDGQATVTGYYGECTNYNITIPEMIGEYPVTGMSEFYLDSSVDTIIIPASVTSIGKDAFLYAHIKKITVAEDNEYYSSDEYGVLFNKGKTELICFPRELDMTEYTVPDGVVTIADNAFRSSYYLTAIRLPEGLISIGEESFASLDITWIQLPSTVEIIGREAF